MSNKPRPDYSFLVLTFWVFMIIWSTLGLLFADSGFHLAAYSALGTFASLQFINHLKGN